MALEPFQAIFASADVAKSDTIGNTGWASAQRGLAIWKPIMRHAAVSAMRPGLFAVAAAGLLTMTSLLTMTGAARAEYFCSPGFDAIGSRCVATVSVSEVDLYLNEPVYDEAPRPLHRVRHHRRHVVRVRY